MDELRQHLAIPEIARQAKVSRRPSQGSINLSKLTITEPPRTSRAFSLHQPCQSLFLEAAYPVGYGSWAITQQLGNMATAHPFSHQKYAMQPVVVPGLLGPTNLVLEPHNYCLCIGDYQLSHRDKIPYLDSMRN
jgi:hypothetical protein